MPINSLKLSIDSWNIKGLRWPAGTAPKLYEDAAHALQGSDVAVLQEAFEDNEMQGLIAEAGYPNVAKGREQWPRLLYNSGLYVLSRHTFGEIETDVFGDSAGADQLATKGVLATQILAEGAPPVWIVTTHMQAQTGYDPTRKLQVKQLAKFLKEKLGHPDTPIILAGDVNMKPCRPEHESYPLMLEETGMTDVGKYCLDNQLEIVLGDDLDENDIYRTTNDRHFVHPKFLGEGGAGAALSIVPLRVARSKHVVRGKPLSDHANYRVDYRLSWQ